jgi:hypothetical protein
MPSPLRISALLALLLSGVPFSARAAQVKADPSAPQETGGVQKAKAASAFGLRLGGIRAFATVDGDVGANGLGVYWFHDTRSLFIDVSVDGFWATETQQIVAGFGGYLPLTSGDFAPYAGGGLRYAWTRYGHGEGHGFQPYAEVGILLGRYSSVAIRGQIEWWVNTFATDGKTANGGTWNLGVQF